MNLRLKSNLKTAKATYLKPKIEPFNYNVQSKIFINDFLQDMSILEKKVKTEVDILHDINQDAYFLIHDVQAEIDNFEDRMIACYGFKTTVEIYKDFLELRAKNAKEQMTDPINDISAFENYVVDLESLVGDMLQQYQIERNSDVQNVEDFLNNKDIENERLVLKETEELNKLIIENQTRKVMMSIRKKKCETIRATLQLKGDRSTDNFKIHESIKDNNQNQSYEYELNRRACNICDIRINEAKELADKSINRLNIMSIIENKFIENHLQRYKEYREKHEKILNYRKILREISHTRARINQLKEDNLSLFMKLTHNHDQERINLLLKSYEADKANLEIRNMNIFKRQVIINKKDKELKQRKRKYNKTLKEYSLEIQKQEEFLHSIKKIEKNGEKIQEKCNTILKEIQKLTNLKPLTVPADSEYSHLNKVVSFLTDPSLTNYY